MPGYLSSKSEFNALYMKHIMACRNPKATEQQTNVFGLSAIRYLQYYFIGRRTGAEKTPSAGLAIYFKTTEIGSA